MPSASRSSSSKELPPGDFPLITPKPKEEKETDWEKIAAIVGAVVGAILVALAMLSLFKFLPVELLGGPLGTGIVLIVGVGILLPAAYILFKKWYLS